MQEQLSEGDGAVPRARAQGVLWAKPGLRGPHSACYKAAGEKERGGQPWRVEVKEEDSYGEQL